MKVSVKFFWRDFWVGLYLSDEESKLVVCLLPMFPIIFEWGKTLPARTAHWEAVPDDPHPEDETGGRFWRVRWSEPLGDKGYLYVRHYGGNGTAWNQMAAEGDARRLNEQHRLPSEWL